MKDQEAMPGNRPPLDTEIRTEGRGETAVGAPAGVAGSSAGGAKLV